MTPEQLAAVSVMQEQVKDLMMWRNQFVLQLSDRLDKLHDMIQRELRGRPTWTVTVMLTFFSSLSVGLLAYVLH